MTTTIVCFVFQGDSLTFGVQGYMWNLFGALPASIEDSVRWMYPGYGVANAIGRNISASGTGLPDFVNNAATKADNLIRENVGAAHITGCVNTRPRDDATSTHSDTNRQAFISRVTSAGWQSTHGITTACRFDQDATMGYFGSWTDHPTLWNSDHVHPTPAGWATATITSAFSLAVNAEISRLS
jgi:hypothetical protein